MLETSGTSEKMLDDSKVQDFAALLWVDVSVMRQQLHVLKDGQESLVSGQNTLKAMVANMERNALSGPFLPSVLMPNGSVSSAVVPGEEAEKNHVAEGSRALAKSHKSHTELWLEDKAEAQKRMHDRRRKRFEDIIEMHHAIDERARKIKETKDAMRQAGLLKRVQTFDRHALETVIDSVTSVAIVANALFIGASLDDNDRDGSFDTFHVLNLGFALFFTLELILKISIQGCHGVYCGKDRIANIFDTFLVVLDGLSIVIMLTMDDIKGKMESNGFPAPSIFRIVRLARLCRIIRLLRIDAFHDLLAMVGGLVGGAFTLFWATVLLFLIVYVSALVCREMFGGQYQPEVYEYFRSVPRSMFTVFRCSFGDCSSKTGVPIPEFIHKYYGGFASLIYCAFLFCVVIGLFNVISAIFVDSTLAANAEAAARTRHQRFTDVELWAESVTNVLKEMLRESQEYAYLAEMNWSENLDVLLAIEFPRSILESVLNSNRHVGRSLQALDIDSHEHYRLPEILDPDHSGTVNILELVSGLEKIRGEPRRSDIISIDLMVRSMQESIDELSQKTMGVQKMQEEMQSASVRNTHWYSHISPPQERHIINLCTI